MSGFASDPRREIKYYGDGIVSGTHGKAVKELRFHTAI